LQVLIPEEAERTEVHRVIYDELVLGRIEEASRVAYRRVVAGLVAQGAEAIIFGCTEIGLLINQSDSPVPVFDTTTIHAEAAVRFAIEP
jgi:aspartate racemase